MDIQTPDTTAPDFSKREQRNVRREEKEQERRQHERMKRVRRATMWSIVVVLLAGLVFGLYKAVRSVPSDTNGPLAVAVSDSDWSLGDKDAKATLVEYSDFQCPACGAYEPLVQQLLKDFGPSKLRLIYRHFPLRSLHPNAEVSARVAEAAGKQNKFWDMHNLLFKNQNDWSSLANPMPKFIEYATSLKLNVAQFQTDLADQSIADAVQSDYEGGLQSRIDSTPTFFLNGKKIASPQSYDEFKKHIDQALAQTQ